MSKSTIDTCGLQFREWIVATDERTSRIWKNMVRDLFLKTKLKNPVEDRFERLFRKELKSTKGTNSKMP